MSRTMPHIAAADAVVSPRGGSRAFWADTTALLIYSTLGAGFSELVIAGLAPLQVLTSRLTTVPVVLLTARPYGIWRDWLFRRAGAEAGPLRRLLLDTIAFLSFQVPVYVGILLLAGAEPRQIARAVAGAIVVISLSGRPYGLLLEACRRWFGVR